jgi:hypothetical protein
MSYCVSLRAGGYRYFCLPWIGSRGPEAKKFSSWIRKLLKMRMLFDFRPKYGILNYPKYETIRILMKKSTPIEKPGSWARQISLEKWVSLFLRFWEI